MGRGEPVTGGGHRVVQRVAATGDVLIAGPDARLAPTHYRDWLRKDR